MLINNWYAACLAADLSDTPRRVRMLAHDFVLFRDAAGAAHCLSDYCCHRGARLSQGECAGDALRCPQHGWEFTGSGRCSLIPAGIKTPTEPPKRARVPAYPVTEKYGLVFVFLGDMSAAERPPVPDIMPEWDSGEWHSDVVTRSKGVNYMRMCENYNDPCHVHYIHEFAKWLPKGVTIVDHQLTDRYVKAWHASWDADGNYSDNAGLMMEYDVISCVSRNTNYQPGFPPQIVTAYVTPIDAANTQIHMIILMPKSATQMPDGSEVRAATADEHKMIVDMTRDTVMDEDYVVLKNTRPLLPAHSNEELLVETDRTLVQVRKMTLAYGEQHGSIDVSRLRELQDAHITVVPCPAHRDDPKGWVHPLTPLAGGAAVASLKAAG